MGTRAENDRTERDPLSFWTLGQVTEFCDPPPKFGTGSRSLGDLAHGNPTGVSLLPHAHPSCPNCPFHLHSAHWPDLGQCDDINTKSGKTSIFNRHRPTTTITLPLHLANLIPHNSSHYPFFLRLS